MHRSLSNLTLRVERFVTRRLLPALYPDVEPVDVEAAHLPGEPGAARGALAVADAPLAGGEAGGRPCAPLAGGEPWGRAWSTTWFRFTGQVPARMRGRRVELLVDLGFER